MSDTKVELPAYVKPGATIRLFWNEGNSNNKTIHIRAIVDDEYVVYRWWSRRKGWLYKVEWAYWFQLLDQQGVTHIVKKGREMR